MNDTDSQIAIESPVSASLPAPVISVRNISKQFELQTILKGISFEISEGEFLVVLGPSGSGKTTLLRIIAGLEQPDHGDIFLNGCRANDYTPQQRELGVVFQEQALFQKMTAEQNIAFGLRVRNARREAIQQTVDEMLELTQMVEHRRKYPAQLSGGQRQRVAVARALAHRPHAMLFDEPFSALDPVTRTEIRREVRSLLRGLNVSALFITHDQEEALEMADNVTVLHNGSIEQSGTPFEIYNRPMTEFVATFLGAANVLLGSWRSNEVVIGGLRISAPEAFPVLVENQAVKLVFRPEDAVLNFQPQLLDTPHYLGRGIVEAVSYSGPTERLIVRIPLWRTPENTAIRNRNLSLVESVRAGDFPITVSRTKWEASEMELSAGDPVAVGLKGYRLLPHYPIGK